MAEFAALKGDVEVPTNALGLFNVQNVMESYVEYTPLGPLHTFVRWSEQGQRVIVEVWGFVGDERVTEESYFPLMTFLKAKSPARMLSAALRQCKTDWEESMKNARTARRNRRYRARTRARRVFARG